MKTKGCFAIACAVAAFVFAGARPTHAASLSFIGTSASNTDLKARVDFVLTGTTLTVTLTNLSTAGVGEQGDILTAVGWDDGPATPGTLTNIAVQAGSSIISVNGSGTNPADLGGYGYAAGGQNGGAPTDFALSACGLSYSYNAGILKFDGAGNVVAGANSDIGGAAGGLANGIDSSVNGGTQGPLVNNAFVFTITGVSGVIDDIDDVRFQFGTATNEASADGLPTPPGADLPAPAPTSAAAGSALLAALATTALARRKRTPAAN